MQKINNWLANPKRTMEDGVELFQEVATQQLIEKYLLYFQKNITAKAHTTPYGMLVNKLNFIEQNKLYSPKKVEKVIPPVEVVKPVVETKLSDLDGVSENLKPVALRIKEIVPIIAALTAKIAIPELPVNEAKEASEELVALEQERRELWAKIDAVKEEVEVDKVTIVLTADDKRKQIKALKEKINRNQLAADKATKENKKVSSLALVAKYKEELTIVEASEVVE